MTEHLSAAPTGKPTSYSRVTLSKIMTAVDVNLYGTVHGGVMMKFVDDVAGRGAARHSGGTAVTAAIDEIVFLEPVRVGDLVHAHAQVNWTGQHLDGGRREGGRRALGLGRGRAVRVATAYLVFVAWTWTGSPARSAGAAGDGGGRAAGSGRRRSAVRTGWPAAGHPGPPRRLTRMRWRGWSVGRARVGRPTRCAEWRFEVGQDGATAQSQCRVGPGGGWSSG